MAGKNQGFNFVWKETEEMKKIRLRCGRGRKTKMGNKNK